ncbi:MAG: Holliday junction branch migration protein RuvA [Bacteroidales bacterium]|nr:Holliday junction branch migration protein RuvA [Bacteroidales bacterium]
MYEYLNGKFALINPSFVVVDCNGVGYKIEISLNTYSQIKEKKEGKVFVHFIVREDMQVLYGFADEKERELFRLLIGVSGIGPNTARVILSSLNSDELVKAIRDEDLKSINAIKGIGNKTAQRVIVDLKDKVQKWDYSSEISSMASQKDNKNHEQALLALQTLGFNKIIIEKTLDKILKENSQMDVENLIKEALKRL